MQKLTDVERAHVLDALSPHSLDSFGTYCTGTAEALEWMLLGRVRSSLVAERLFLRSASCSSCVSSRGPSQSASSRDHTR